MPPKTQATALNTEQVQFLCQVVQHSEPPKKETWDLIARNLNITNGNAAYVNLLSPVCRKCERIYASLVAKSPCPKSYLEAKQTTSPLQD